MKKQYVDGIMAKCLLLLLLVSASCTDKLSPGDDPFLDKSAIRLTLGLNVSGVGAGQTRMAEADQTKIENVRVLVFDDNGLFKYEVPFVTLSGNTVTVRLLPSTSGEEYQLVLLANAPMSNSAPIVNETKGTVLRKFVFSSTGSWPDNKAIPMCGESNFAVVADGVVFKNADESSSSIRMIRALARVDVGVKFNNVLNPTDNTVAPGGLSNFNLKSVYVYNSKNMGYIAADVVVPNLPSAVPGWGNNTPPLHYSLSGMGGNAWCGNIFLAEANAGVDNGANNTGLVLGGYYGVGNTTKETYYRVDFIETHTNQRLPVLRNCLYRVNIAQASGPGAATPDEAWSTVRSELDYEVVGWKYEALQEMIHDGVNYFSCATRTPVLGYASGSMVGIFASSNVPEAEWEITPENVAAANKVEVLSGGGSGNIGFRSKGKGGTSTGLSLGEEARFKMKVKNMETTFVVTQKQTATNLEVGSRPGITPPTADGGWTGNVPLDRDNPMLSGANCFIVTRDGTWTLDATVKGNGVGTNTNIPIVATDRAEVLWESDNSDTPPQLGSIVRILETSQGKIYFAATTKEGNAVIVLKNAAGDIKWSWHIWRINKEPEGIKLSGISNYLGNPVNSCAGPRLADAINGMEIMDRDIGALNCVPYKVSPNLSEKSIGLIYQYGRHMPFSFSADLSNLTARGTAVTPFGAINYQPLTTYITNSDQMERMGSSMVYTPGGTPPSGIGYLRKWLPEWAVADTIKGRVNGQNRFAGLVLQTVGYIGKKGKDDPCPKGWQIAPHVVWTEIFSKVGATTFAEVVTGRGVTLELGPSARKVWFPLTPEVRASTSNNPLILFPQFETNGSFLRHWVPGRGEVWADAVSSPSPDTKNNFLGTGWAAHVNPAPIAATMVALQTAVSKEWALPVRCVRE